MNMEDLIETVPGLGEIASRCNLILILQFGSTVTGKIHDRSDLDLAVQLDSFPVSLQTILEIQEALQVQFTGSKVDLAILNGADPLFLKKITDSCRMLYGTPKDFARLRLHAFKAFQDFRPYLELESRYVAQRLAALTAEPSQS
jgi:predicted nucleotidyltransferase